jgi:hypothetical protein
MSKNKNTVFQNLWDQTKAELTGEIYVSVSANSRKESLEPIIYISTRQNQKNEEVNLL